MTDQDTEGRDRLAQMFEMQDKFQELAVGVRFSALAQEALVEDSNVDRIYQFKEMHTALNAEQVEALDEMGWKPWATSRHFNEEAVRGEIIDAWHFLMNQFLLAGGTPDMFYEEYIRKISVNIDRQTRASGYDGVSDKCHKCKRALDDPATECKPPGFSQGGPPHLMIDDELVGRSRVGFCAEGGLYAWGN